MDKREAVTLLNDMADALEYLDEPFRAKAYRKAADALSMLNVPIRTLIADGSIRNISGIGKGISSTLASWEQGDFSGLSELTSKLPAGLPELLKVPGLGIKRIRELQLKGIETLEDLNTALEKGRLNTFKGLTARFEARIRKAITDIIEGRGRILLDSAFEIALHMNEIFKLNGIDACITGELRRTEETISSVDFLITEENDTELKLKEIFGEQIVRSDGILTINMRKAPKIKIFLTEKKARSISLFLTTGSGVHVEKVKARSRIHGCEINESCILKNGAPCFPDTERDLYEMIGLSYIPPEIREGENETDFASRGAVPVLIGEKDTVGTIHNHTTYSDGRASLAEMAQSACELGYKWIGISDHSITAHYAGGMSLKSLRRQHAEIDALNEKTGIRIFKGIECDIQQDGSLDYGYEVLNSFDFVIASIHTKMDMDEGQMTQRIITAVRNPATSILAHPTGRLLLARSPYEVDMDAVLEECLLNKVIVEINANPQRLDLGWRKVNEFITAGGMVAISPDAHNTEGLNDMKFGLMMARKGLVEPCFCINSFDAEEALACLKRSR
ncbi:MAG TPA: PHP domain-containing protein [Desulfomonilia bacterium]